MAGHLEIEPALHLGGQIKDFDSHSAKSSANPQVAVDQPTSCGTPTWRRRTRYHISLTDINICQSLFRDCRAPSGQPGCGAASARHPSVCLSGAALLKRGVTPTCQSRR